ncbi:hypothetical protein ACJ73_05231 [Blastomyces percursus]|uniref:Ubiquitin-like domain-containing protein n=1 Tax=Blastomyces percursus TaxID=1658174 RepID=A0A1J9R4I6_9EURO|nr:hypothetical protein ACJ73_05231 [Blastomyces percursus]
MTELTFTKAFLAALDTRPVKLSGDYVFDPNSFSAPHPYTLSRLSDFHPPMPKKIKQTAIPGSSKSITIHLKSARNPTLHITLDNCAISSTTVRELRETVQGRVQTADHENKPGRVPLEKIKILWKKKPVQGQTIADILGSDSTALWRGKEIELGVMILGGATLAPATPKEEKVLSKDPPESLPGQGPVEHCPRAAQDVLSTEEFWDDLESFMTSKVKDAAQASQIKSIFRKAWTSCS